MKNIYKRIYSGLRGLTNQIFGVFLKYSGSVSTKLIGATLLVLAMITVTSSTFAILNEKKILGDQLDAHGMCLANTVAVFSAMPIFHGKYSVLQNYSTDLIEEKLGVAFISITDKNGKTIAKYPGQQVKESVQIYDAEIKAGDSEALGKVQVGILTNPADKLIAFRIFELGIEAIMVFLGISTILFLVVKKIVADPLNTIGKQVAALGDGDMETPITTMTGDNELVQLADTLDGMRLQIQQSLKKLKQNEERARAASKAKSDFLNVISHELRTPLTVIKSNLQELCDPEVLEEIDQEDILEIASDALEDAEHLHTLINDVLDFSKIEAGKMSLNLESFTVTDVINNTLYSIRTIADKKELSLSSEIARDIQIKADPIRLKQILFNLIGNAVKFTHKGGAITVKVVQNKTHAEFSVHDTGEGIPEDKLEHIFSLFTQADGTLKRAASGTGLGLPICEKLVNLHGGKIWVKSKLDRGSNFFFTIPLAETDTDIIIPEELMSITDNINIKA